eukprot:6171909-Alexandrium_andersonii.AAC.1
MLQVVRKHRLRGQLVGAPGVDALAPPRVLPQAVPVAEAGQWAEAVAPSSLAGGPSTYSCWAGRSQVSGTG